MNTLEISPNVMIICTFYLGGLPYGPFRNHYFGQPHIYLYLGGGFKDFLFLPLPGEMIQFDEHIFQVGWFNHQPVNAGSLAWGLYYDCQVLFVQCGLIFCQSHISDSFASGFSP